MLRGRHRGLPVAIDRAVILPFEFREPVDELPDKAQESPQRRGSQESAFANGTYNGTYNGTDGPPSEKLQRRSWRTASPDSIRQQGRSSSKERQPSVYGA